MVWLLLMNARSDAHFDYGYSTVARVNGWIEEKSNTR